MVECITTSPNADRIFADIAGERATSYLPNRVLRDVDPGGPNEPAQIRSDVMVIYEDVGNTPSGRMVLVKDGDTLINLLVVNMGPSPDMEMLSQEQIDRLVATAVGNLPRSCDDTISTNAKKQNSTLTTRNTQPPVVAAMPVGRL